MHAADAKPPFLSSLAVALAFRGTVACSTFSSEMLVFHFGVYVQFLNFASEMELFVFYWGVHGVLEFGSVSFFGFSNEMFVFAFGVYAQFLNYSSEDSALQHTTEKKLRTFYCSCCGANACVTEVPLEELPRRGTDCAYVLQVTTLNPKP